MKLAGISIVRNECDVIEAFVRYNLRFLDRLIVADNLSTDSTRRILELLRDEGLPLDLESADQPDHPQELVLNAMLARAAKEGYDFIFPLDADEFIGAESRVALESGLAAIPLGQYGLMPWYPYITTSTDEPAERNVLKRITHKLAPTKPEAKVVAPGRMVLEQGLTLSVGNHHCLRDGRALMDYAVPSGVHINHFPLRSPEQARLKVAVGAFAIKARGWREPTEGWNWLELYARWGLERPIAVEDLAAQTARIYGGKACSPQPWPAPLPPTELRHGDLIRVDPVHDVLAQAEILLERLDRIKYHHGPVSVARTRFGPMMHLDDDTPIGRSLRCYGEWAAREISLLRSLYPPGGIVIDAGAGIGTHTVPLAQYAGARGQLLAFEPQRVVFHLLCGNVALNNLRNVQTFLLVLGSAPGKKHMASASPESVQVVPLDQFAFPTISLIRINTGGMECKVIEGARETLHRCRPALFVANEDSATSEMLIRELFALNYRCWWHFEPMYNPLNTYGNPRDVFVDIDRPRIHLLGLPAERKPAVTGRPEVRDAGEDWKAVWAAFQTK
jgi:FkbM family methyltransferase